MKKKIHLIASSQKLDPLNIVKQRKVAVYARVSTDSCDQLNSMEAQMDYYKKYIDLNQTWKLTEIYADAGISGIMKKTRPEFQRMITDAINKKFDLIITKSISRFARNTVDCISTLRKLKEHNIEVWFQKEDIWSLDSNGEFLLTLLSCMAQEESRSISENVTWGQRKRFADGKYSVPFKHFLGYNKSAKGEFIINEDEAKIVKLIYKLYLEGYTVNHISKYLMNLSILSPGGKDTWSETTIKSILTNEKYKGDALLQKKFTVDFLQKKMKVNEGEVNKYYVTNGHPAIIQRKTFDYVQKEIERRRDNFGNKYSSSNPLSLKIHCAYCNNVFSLSSSGSGKYKRRYWVCKEKIKDKYSCQSTYISETKLFDILRKTFIGFIMKNEDVFPLLKNLLQKNIKNKKKERIQSIIEMLDSLLLSELNLIITDEILSIVISEIVISNGFVEVRLIDGYINKSC